MYYLLLTVIIFTNINMATNKLNGSNPTCHGQLRAKSLFDKLTRFLSVLRAHSKPISPQTRPEQRP